jgi:aspartate dehydrogenase
LPLRIALIGAGAIGSAVLNRLQDDPSLSVAQVIVRESRLSECISAFGNRCEFITDLTDLSPDIDVVFECAGHDAVRRFGPEVLHRGIDFALASVGALADPDLRASLSQAAGAYGAQVLVLPGAIGGSDALAAVGSEGLDTVVYTGRKPPHSWQGSPAALAFDLDAIERPTDVFDGTAAEAARLYPKNANVVATVALAGIGFERTRVRLIADPGATGNSHLIEARGPQLQASYETRSAALPDNPKTSALTVLSAVRLLRNRVQRIVV